jgi:hypothetical protein
MRMEKRKDSSGQGRGTYMGNRASCIAPLAILRFYIGCVCCVSQRRGIIKVVCMRLTLIGLPVGLRL